MPEALLGGVTCPRTTARVCGAESYLGLGPDLVGPFAQWGFAERLPEAGGLAPHRPKQGVCGGKGGAKQRGWAM